MFPSGTGPTRKQGRGEQQRLVYHAPGRWIGWARFHIPPEAYSVVNPRIGGHVANLEMRDGQSAGPLYLVCNLPHTAKIRFHGRRVFTDVDSD